MKLYKAETEERFIDAENFAAQKCGEDINLLLALNAVEPTSYLSEGKTGWYVNGQYFGDVLLGFTGVIDLETGRKQGDLFYGSVLQSDGVICAVGQGWMDGDHVIVEHGPCKKLPIQYCSITNYNQPFDRSYYEIIGGQETNRHYDLMGMMLTCLGHPDFNRHPLLSDSISLSKSQEYFTGIAVDKTDRDALMLGLDLETTIAYCHRDVIATIGVMKNILPIYLEKTPSPIAIYGAVLKHSFCIPLSDHWIGYRVRVEAWYQEQQKILQAEIEESAIKMVLSSVLSPSHQNIIDQFPESYASAKTALKSLEKITSPVMPKLKQVMADNMSKPVTRLKKLNKMVEKGCGSLSAILPLIVGLHVSGEPIKYNRKLKKWFYGENELQNLRNSKDNLQTPFCKDYFDDTRLTSEISTSFLARIKSVQFWVSFKGRMSEIERTDDGWLIPRYSPIGTITNRCADKLILLAGKPKATDDDGNDDGSNQRGGTEFMSFIQAKKGYKLVGADFDSAELVYASIISDYISNSPEWGMTDFSKAITSGSSKDKTDIHSLVATMMGCSRRPAKNLVYGANYGQGKTARRSAIMSIVGCSYSEANKLAEKFEASYIGGWAKSFFDGLTYFCDHKLPTILLQREQSEGVLSCAFNQGITTRKNMPIQSLGQDLIDLLQVDVQRQIEATGIDATICFDRHDEMFYHVAIDCVDEFKEMLQSAHTFVMSALLLRLGFSGVTEGAEKWMQFSSMDVLDNYAGGINIVTTPNQFS